MAGADSIVDSGGTPITVGLTVKLVATVVSINAFDNRYNDVLIQIVHPLVTTPSSTHPALPGMAGPTGGDATVPSYRLQLSVPPTVLTVGS